MKRISRIIVVSILFLGILIYSGLRLWIKSDIKDISEYAQSRYEGEKVEALIAVLTSEAEGLETKNKSVWALGKLRDTSAIPVLKSLQTGKECDHSRYVCQRELEKAIENLERNKVDLITFR